MALGVTTTGRLPEGAIPLTRAEAVDYQWSQIYRWPDKSEVWPFQWGLAGLATLAAGAGSHINRMYRVKLKLRHYGYVTTTLPMIFVPAMFSAGMHAQVITNDLFLQDTKCPLCLQNKAGLIQAATSTLYATVMAPITNFPHASRHATYRIPYWKEVGATLRLWWQITKPMGYTLMTIALVQFSVAAIVTYYEADALYKIHNKLTRPDHFATENSSSVTE